MLMSALLDAITAMPTQSVPTHTEALPVPVMKDTQAMESAVLVNMSIQNSL